MPTTPFHATELLDAAATAAGAAHAGAGLPGRAPVVVDPLRVVHPRLGVLVVAGTAEVGADVAHRALLYSVTKGAACPANKNNIT